MTTIAATITPEVLTEIEKLRGSDLTVEQTAEQLRKLMRMARDAARKRERGKRH